MDSLAGAVSFFALFVGLQGIAWGLRFEETLLRLAWGCLSILHLSSAGHALFGLAIPSFEL
jgi:hypothetical protein